MSYLSSCDDVVDPHYCLDCGDEVEKARIRRGGWLRKTAVAAILADPTNAAVWEAAKAAGDFVALPELSGTFDGGAPKYGPGYGDLKETYLGSDFTAQIKDPLYKKNWPHYRSLVGKSNWHFVFVTETQVHVSGKVVTIAPKNPITENVEDNIIWEAEVKWYERFTPAPHDAPMSVFACDDNGTATVGTFTFKFGFNDTGAPILGDITGASGSGTANESAKVVVDDFGNSSVDSFLWVAEPATEPAKTIWWTTPINNGTIGGSGLFADAVIVGTYRVYVTSYATNFTEALELRVY